MCPQELHNGRWSLGLNAAPRRGDFSPVQGLSKRQGIDQQFDHGLPQSDVLRFENRQKTYRPGLTPGIGLLLQLADMERTSNTERKRRQVPSV
jgi:hypothetical protein